MARNGKKHSGEPSKGAQVAKIGVGAAMVAFLLWLTGGFSRHDVAEWLKSIGLAVLIALAIRWVLAEPFRIPSGSMRPTLVEGDRLLVNKWVYGLRFPLNGFQIPWTHRRVSYANRRIWRGASPQRWDIVVFHSVEEKTEHNVLVKRVVGLPGERIHIQDGSIYADGEKLELPTGMEGIKYTRPGSHGYYGIDRRAEYMVVPEDCYLVLGDNSGSSRDGRYWGWLPNEHILGRVSCIWWPPRHWRDFTGFTKTLWWRSVVTLLSVLLFWRLFLGRSWRVHDNALPDTVSGGEHAYIHRTAYGLPVPFTSWRLVQWRAPRRGDLVLYRAPALQDKDTPPLLLGRVAGLPGEHVHLDGWKLRVNGAFLGEPASLTVREFHATDATGPYGRSQDEEHSHVPDGCYFVLCDNPDEGADSRTLGWIPEGHIIGPVTAVWWPFTHLRRIRP